MCRVFEYRTSSSIESWRAMSLRNVDFTSVKGIFVSCLGLLFATTFVCGAVAQDWLVDPIPYRTKSTLVGDGKQIIISNGLIERRFLLSPNAATVGFRNLTNGETILRGIKPEATVTLDGIEHSIGGLVGQENYAFLDPSIFPVLRTDPQSFQFQGYDIRPVLQERFAWRRARHHAPDAAWPPKGLELVLRYSMPSAVWKNANTSRDGRTLLLEDQLRTREPSWNWLTVDRGTKAADEKAPQVLTIGELEKVGDIQEANNIRQGLVFCGLPGQGNLLERVLPENTSCVEVEIAPGTDQDTSWGPGLALVWEDGILEVNLRPGDRGEHGHFELRNRGREQLATVDKFAHSDRGLDSNRRYSLRARWQNGEMRWDVADVTGLPEGAAREYHKLFDLGWDGRSPMAVRLGKSDRQGNATNTTVTRDGNSEDRKRTYCVFSNFVALGPWDENLIASVKSPAIQANVHYEFYDGLPAYCKWIEVVNPTEKELVLDRYCSDLLAAVEHTSEVDTLTIGLTPPNLHIETEMAFGGMTSQGANRRSYRWVEDPQYHTQVNYEKKTPCLLNVGPDLGPAQRIPPGETWSSYRGWVLSHDNYDRERCGLAVRKLMRCIAPWVTENPLMMHLTASDEVSVMRAIEQCEAVGFEMLILSFGSGFNLESMDPAVLEKARRYSEAAKAKGIEIGSYSLLASRSVSKKDDVVMRDGQKPAFGNSPCLKSEWGNRYFGKLYDFHRASGFTLLEHDGSYPGDSCASDAHPGHLGYEDSRWNQWDTISEFYRWCRSEGLFLNVPDHYFLVGSNKTGMGYREVNWSLPREQQLIHTRQNIYDGTWQKTPSMGWMFVPLTEYHGGGPKATIEPLDQNIAHYQNMLQSNLALGVQACYRGPRLYDTDRVKLMVRGEVEWYKKYRDILESDLIHGRRPDAMHLDWYLHANPSLPIQGMFVVFNPTAETLSEKVQIPMHYTGIRNEARIWDTRPSDPNGEEKRDGELPKGTVGEVRVVTPQETMEFEVSVPPFSMRSFAIEKWTSPSVPVPR